MASPALHADFDACKDTELLQVWDPGFMALGMFASFMGAFVALTIMGFARNMMDGTKESFRAYVTFVASSGVALGGSSVWTMHFIGMQALSLVTCTGTVLPAQFNIVVSFVSLVAAIFATGLAMHLVMPTTIVGEEEVVVDGTKVDRKFRVKLPFVGVVPFEKFNLRRWIASSVFLMTAAAAMHYMGMMSQSGPYYMSYDPVLIFVSMIIAAVAAAAGLFIVIQVAPLDPVTSVRLRVGAAVIIGLAVNCMHYVGMQAASYSYTGDRSTSLLYVLGPTFEPNSLHVCIISLTFDFFQLFYCQHFMSKYLYMMEQNIKRMNQKLPDNVQEVLDETLEKIRPLDGGALADYIPELALANPDHFGIAICDTNGNIYKTGDCDIHATIQSASKPLLYMLALTERGPDAVDKKVGEEPSGRPFDEISIDADGRAFNPLINTGAIACTGLMAGTSNERYNQFETLVKRSVYRPDEISMDESVYKSEMSCNHANLKIVDALLEKDIIPAGEGELALDAYTRVCSMSVTAMDLAVMGATMAKNGTNPVSGEFVFPEAIVNKMVTVMMSCGMYSGAGKWIVEVGIPAKSGVGGFLLCVVPGVCGIGIFSPKLNRDGNTTRGVSVAKELSEKLGLHVLKQDEGDGSSHKPDDKKKAKDKKSKGSTKNVKVAPVSTTVEQTPVTPMTTD